MHESHYCGQRGSGPTAAAFEGPAAAAEGTRRRSGSGRGRFGAKVINARVGHGRRHRRRDDRLSALAGRPRGRPGGAQGRPGAGDELGQRRHDRARPLVRLVLAPGADDPAQVLVRQEPGAPLSAVGRSSAVDLVPAVPAPMHRGAGAHQHAAQAPPVHVLAEDPARDGRQQRSALRSDQPGHSLLPSHGRNRSSAPSGTCRSWPTTARRSGSSTVLRWSSWSRLWPRPRTRSRAASTARPTRPATATSSRARSPPRARAAAPTSGTTRRCSGSSWMAIA